MILKDIEDKLLELTGNEGNVFYGSATKLEKWNYAVVQREKISIDDKFSKTNYYKIAIVRENYIPEGYEETVISKMKEIKLMKVANRDIEFSYVKRPNTNTVIEVMEITFVKAVGRCLTN